MSSSVLFRRCYHLMSHEDFAVMSEYSLDSLESIVDDSLVKRALVNNDNGDNLGKVKSDNKSNQNASFQLNSVIITSPQIKDNTAETNCTVREDRCTSATGGRNSIITSGREFARRQREYRATREEPWLCIRKRNDVGEWRAGEGDASRCCRRTSRHATTTATEMERRSLGARNSSSKCSLRDGRDGMRADKKLGNVLEPWIGRGPARTTSYSELYHRRFNIPRYPPIQSPEGSTLSICGDSQLEELSLDEGRSSLPAISRGNSSELSFYRRFVEDHAARATCTGRSCEILCCGIPSDVVSLRAERERSVSDSKKPTYRPYTIEEYRSLSVPKPDRSLGPDKDEVQVKREWLMRRRSYGDSVSARNREQILKRTRRFKTRRAIAQKCFLSPLKDWDAAASKNRESSRIPETNNVTQESLLKRPVMCPRESTAADEALPYRKIETLEKTPSFSSSLVLYATLEDPYLPATTTLQQRHLQEKELAERLMRQALNS